MKAAGADLVFRAAVLVLIYVLAFVIRLFSVVKYESMIHEFDPYFNYRATQLLVEKGFHEFWNWFDDKSWYPLGRAAGVTLYPGLMLTAALLHWVLKALTFTVSIKDVCVFTGPFFASNTAMVAYLFGKEMGNSKTGLFAAAIVAICPGYISRSVAGSFDNEAVAIFAMLLTFYLFVKAVKSGSLAWSAACALSYLYMVSSWGGYVFITNLLPLYVLVLLVTGRRSLRLYIAYNTVYILGMLLAMQIPFVGFQHVRTGEHMAPMAVFFIMQVLYLGDWVRSQLADPEPFRNLLKLCVVSAVGAGLVVLFIGMATGYIAPWTGRLYSLLNPSYRSGVPLIASIAEHQTTAWRMYEFNLHRAMLFIFFPAGFYFCLRQRTDGQIFLVVYSLASLYFSWHMVRLILVAAPAFCLTSAIGASEIIGRLWESIKAQEEQPLSTPTPAAAKKKSKKNPTPCKPSKRERHSWEKPAAVVALAVVVWLFTTYVTHATWVSSEFFSSPTVIVRARTPHGEVSLDDYREAYSWLRNNSPADAKILSWWDYGYQISSMADRTVIVDNNTWNNTHIATVGRALASRESKAVEIMRSLDADYVLVVNGDLFKLPWMVRIAGSVFPDIREGDYGRYRLGQDASPTMSESLLYKLNYFRYAEAFGGWDRQNGVKLGNKIIRLKHLEEAFTSANWIVRIYRLKPPNNTR